MANTKKANPLTPAERQKRFTATMKEKGFKNTTIWAHPDDIVLIRKYAAQLTALRELQSETA